MIENKKDAEATKAARKAHIINAPSWISIAGHVYLESAEDKRVLRLNLMAAQRNICAICNTYCSSADGDLDHIKSGRPVARCWCYFQTLANGKLCTNVRFIHGMFSTKPCHRDRHNREPKWTPKHSRQ